MKEVKYFMCEHCGTRYADKENAKCCENQHCIPTAIVGSEHKAMKDHAQYPIRIHIQFDDGSVIVYEKTSKRIR